VNSNSFSASAVVPQIGCFRIHKKVITALNLHFTARYFAVGPRWLASFIESDATRAKPSRKRMKYAGLLVMPAGFFLTVTALVLFADQVRQAVFVVCGLAVEAMGLVVAVRGHMPARGASRL
jgi:hypothetical protein